MLLAWQLLFMAGQARAVLGGGSATSLRCAWGCSAVEQLSVSSFAARSAGASSAERRRAAVSGSAFLPAS